MGNSAEKSGSVKGKVKGAAIVGLVGAAGFFALSPKQLDLLSAYPGDEGQVVGKRVLEKRALRQYEKAYHQASPAGKFRLQYLTKNEYSEPTRDGAKGLFGFLQGLSDDSERMIQVNNACLEDTAYDPSGPVESHVADGHPHKLVIETPHDLPNLKFNTARNHNRLIAAGQKTAVILRNHDCQLGVALHTTQPGH